MPDPNPAALEFLLTRRSRPARMLVAPYPDRAAIEIMLTAATRTPDHGKLNPWRFIVLGPAALARLAALAEERGPVLGLEEEKTAKLAATFNDAGCVIAVIESPKPSDKIPGIEQTYSVGGACLALLNAALALGWGANWLTGWAAYDREFMSRGLELADQERIAGFIHLGTEKIESPDRPRPDLASLTRWMDA